IDRRVPGCPAAAHGRAEPSRLDSQVPAVGTAAAGDSVRRAGRSHGDCPVAKPADARLLRGRPRGRSARLLRVQQAGVRELLLLRDCDDVVGSGGGSVRRAAIGFMSTGAPAGAVTGRQRLAAYLALVVVLSLVAFFSSR